VWGDEPCLRRGQLFNGTIIAGGKVIHHPRDTGAAVGALASVVHNFGKHIRDDMNVAPGKRSAARGNRLPKFGLLLFASD
jgi:hypothetical protein